MQQFDNFIASLQLDENIKERFLDVKIKKKHKLYTELVPFFSPLFSNVNEDILERLSLSSYLYFRFLLAFDDFIDASQEQYIDKELTFQFITLHLEFYEQSISELARLFSYDDTFWIKFRNAKKLYKEGLIYEKKISKLRTPISKQQHENLAIQKSSLCHALAYALTSLSGNQQWEKVIIQSLDYIHIGLQYLDDVEDFKKDVREGKWNYVQFLVHDYMERNYIQIEDVTVLHKHLYLSLIAQQVINDAIENFEKALGLLRPLNLNKIVLFLESTKEICFSFIKEINLLYEKTTIKSLVSNTLSPRSSVNDSIDAGVNYLKSNIDSKYRWRDFITSAGFGNGWVTAYIGLQLVEIVKEKHFFSNIIHHLLDSGEAGSFNDSVMKDGDSLNFLIGFLHKSDYPIPQILIDTWVRYMDKGGGWVTYRDGEQLKQRLGLEDISVDGWLSSKLCVTAAAAYVVSDIHELNALYQKSSQYLFSNICDNNYWASYWWTSPVYATSFSIMALAKNENNRMRLAKVADWLANIQVKKGYWTNYISNEASPFYTALAMKALSLLDKHRYKKIIDKSMIWLLENQTTDGSWATNRILRIPATDVENPATVGNWRNSSFGVNCLVDDHHRLFSTSTIVNALHHAYSVL